MATTQTAIAIGNGHKTLRDQSHRYIPVALDDNPLFCGDDRPVEGPYIQLFGGVINLAYNQAVVEETLHAQSVKDSLQDRVKTMTVTLGRKHMHPGVHSDIFAEEGIELCHDRLKGPVGCAYAEKRPLISKSIAELGVDLVDEANRLCPELFRKPEDRAFGLGVTAAHGRLAKRRSFQTKGRDLVLTAAAEGAEVAVLEGRHVAGDGIINLEPDTSLDSDSSSKEGLPAYNHDAWAAEEIFEQLDVSNESTANQRQIANLIDVLGTMHALGVEAIIVHRS